MTGRARSLAFAALVMAGSVSLTAHHSFSAEYDANKPIKLTGAVTQMKWSNPHAWIYMDVKDKSGKVVNWRFETGPANALYRRGWRKEDLMAGTKLTIEAYQARNGTPTANAQAILLPDGKRLFTGSSSPNAPAAK